MLLTLTKRVKLKYPSIFGDLLGFAEVNLVNHTNKSNPERYTTSQRA